MSEYTFDDLVEVRGNAAVVASARAVASGEHAAGCVVLHGRAPVGKSHLLHAIEQQVSTNHPEMKVRRITAEEFINEVVSGARSGQMQDYLAGLESAGILLVDDVNVLRQERSAALAQVARAVIGAGGVVVMTSDRPIYKLHWLDPALKEILAGAETHELVVPDDDERYAWLVREAATGRVPEMSHEVMELLARQPEWDFRTLHGAVARIGAWHGLNGCQVDTEMAAKVCDPQLILDPQDSRLRVHWVRLYNPEDGLQVGSIDVPGFQHERAVPGEWHVGLCLENTSYDTVSNVDIRYVWATSDPEPLRTEINVQGDWFLPRSTSRPLLFPFQPENRVTLVVRIDGVTVFSWHDRTLSLEDYEDWPLALDPS